MLTKVHAQQGSGSTWVDVSTWTLSHLFPDPTAQNPAAATTNASLWLSKVQHIDPTGNTSNDLPATSFDGVPLPNRVVKPNKSDGTVDDATTLFWKFRISSVRTEAGAIVSVNYDQATDPLSCGGWNGQPPSVPTNVGANTKLCFPQWFTPPSGTAELDWFHKYVATSTDTNPGSNQPHLLTTYDYSVGTPAWRYDTSPLGRRHATVLDRLRRVQPSPRHHRDHRRRRHPPTGDHLHLLPRPQRRPHLRQPPDMHHRGNPPKRIGDHHRRRQLAQHNIGTR
jgi:hypothetical protein